MATLVAYDVITMAQGDQYPRGIRVVRWSAMGPGDFGVPYKAPQYSGKAAQIVSTDVGTATACAIQGTLIPTDSSPSPAWASLTNAATNAAATLTTANNIAELLEDCYQVRPLMNAAGAGTTATVYMFFTTSARG